MEYKKYEMGAYNLHLINTDKFKIVTMAINFKAPFKREELTIRNLLRYYLLTATNKYQTKRELDIATEDLYDINYVGSSSLYFNICVMQYMVQFLDEKYTERGMYKKSVEFAFDLVFDPFIIDNHFDENAFNQAKYRMASKIEKSDENPWVYSSDRMNEELGKGEEFGYKSIGYLEELKNITIEELYNYYLNIIKEDYIDIFIVGNINFDKTKKIISSFIDDKHIRRNKKGEFVNHKIIRNKEQVVKEHKDIEQSILKIGFKINKLSKYEREYVSGIYNYVLGDDFNSLLFKEIREKASLCYSIGSNINLSTNTMVITAGIDKKDYDKTLKLIKKQIKCIENGTFDDDLIEKAKKSINSNYKSALDSESLILSMHMGKEYFNVDIGPELIDKINKVTKEEVVKFAQKIHMDTVFILEGSDSNE